MINIGVTGTRSGMTEDQANSVKEWLDYLLQRQDPSEINLHHGDCVGVDVQVAELFAKNGCRTICHPPIKRELQAFHASTEIRQPLSYFARNRNIVNESNGILVIPYQDEWQERGGTWYTSDYAVKKKVPTLVIWPNGEFFRGDAKLHTKGFFE